MPHRWKPNVTVAAVIERDGRFLLVEEDTSDGIRLNNPAGHLDPGESPIQACVREVLEETAFDFKPSALLGVYMNDYLAGQRFPLNLVFTDESVLVKPANSTPPEELE